MIHPATELRFISEEVGYGVFATQRIPRGTLVWVLDAFDRVLTPDEVRELPPVLRSVAEKYSYVTAEGMFVFCWDFGRYMNHSCAPASSGVGEAFEIAIRDIEPGDELTCEYGTLNLIEPLACTCGATTCRGVISGDDVDRLYEQWDEEARTSFRLGLKLPQPLLPYVKIGPRDQPLLDALLTGSEVEVPSVREYLLGARPLS